MKLYYTRFLLFLTVAVASLSSVEAGVPFVNNVRGGSVAIRPKMGRFPDDSYLIDPLESITKEEQLTPTIQIDLSQSEPRPNEVKENLRKPRPGVNAKPKDTQLKSIVDGFQQACQRQQEDLHVGEILSAFQGMEKFLKNSGMAQSAKDVAGNIAKIEESYNRAPRNTRDSMSGLLKWEIENGVHSQDETGHFKIKKEKSGAMGLLWLGRNLKYQYDMYKLMLDDGLEPMEAAQTAFQRDLKPHLPWAAAKLVGAGISAFSPARQSEFFAKIGGFTDDAYGPVEDEAIKHDVHEMLELWRPLIAKWDQIFTSLEMEHL